MKYAFTVCSVLRATSTAAASRLVWLLSMASQEHSVAGVVIASAAAAVGPAVASVAAPPKPETVSEGHGEIGLAQPGLPGGAFRASLQGPGKKVAGRLASRCTSLTGITCVSTA